MKRIFRHISITLIACAAAFTVSSTPTTEAAVQPVAPAIHEADHARGTVLLPRRVKMLISYHQAVTV